MKSQKFFLIIGLLLMFSTVTKKVFSQESQGKPVALIFSNFSKSFTEGSKVSGFDITRAYLGYEYHFSPTWYGYVVLDVGDPKAGDHQFSAFLKNAYLRYSESDLTFLFGMISTTQFKVAEDYWGFRYIEEVFQDLYGFSSSADLGATVSYRFADLLSADLSVFNGEGYHNVQSDDFLKPAIGLTINPVSVVTARLYADYMGDDVKQTSWSGFLAYSDNVVTSGAEYSYQQNVEMIDGYDQYGFSFFASYIPIRNIKVFGRFDMLDTTLPDGVNEVGQNKPDGDLFMGGIEYSPIRGVKFAPNYRYWNSRNTGTSNQHSIFLNCEVRF